MGRGWLKLTLEGYSAWITKELEKFSRPAVSKGRKLLEDAGRSLEEGRRFLEDLAKKADRDMTTKRDPTSYRAARVIGRSAREASEILGRLQVPTEVSLDSLRSIRDALSSATRSLRDSKNQTAGQLAGLYILDMRSFGGVIDRVARSEEKLSEFLEHEGGSLQKARTLSGILSTLQDVRKEIEERQIEKSKLLQEQQVLEEKNRMLDSELETLSKESSLREVIDVERSLRRESRDFRTNDLAHLQRPLRKLRDLSQRGEIPLTTEEREALDRYVVSPYRSFLSKQSGAYIGSILHSLQAALQKGSMGFKPRKTARIASQLNQLLAGQHLSEKQATGRNLLSRRRKLLQDPACQNLYEKRRKTLRQRKEMESYRNEIADRTSSLEDKTKALERRLSDLRLAVETKTKEYTGKQVQIERMQPAA